MEIPKGGSTIAEFTRNLPNIKVEHNILDQKTVGHMDFSKSSQADRNEQQNAGGYPSHLGRRVDIKIYYPMKEMYSLRDTFEYNIKENNIEDLL